MKLQLLVMTTMVAVATAKPRRQDPGQYFQLCSKSDPELNACIKKSIEGARQQLIDGIPALNFPPIDPLYVPEIIMQDNLFFFKMSNLTIRGLGDFKLLDASFDEANKIIGIDLTTQDASFDSDYELDGKILNATVHGKGHVTLNFTGLHVRMGIHFSLVPLAGQEYLQGNSVDWNMDVARGTIHLANLFGGNKQLGDSFNRLINDNWREFFNIYGEIPTAAFAELMKQMLNKVFLQFTYKSMFLE